MHPVVLLIILNCSDLKQCLQRAAFCGLLLRALSHFDASLDGGHMISSVTLKTLSSHLVMCENI